MIGSEFNHHNITGPCPQVTELVLFFLREETHVEIAKGPLPDTAMATAVAYTPGRDNALLSALIASGWAFQHRPQGKLRGEFRVLVTLA